MPYRNYFVMSLVVASFLINHLSNGLMRFTVKGRTNPFSKRVNLLSNKY